MIAGYWRGPWPGEPVLFPAPGRHRDVYIVSLTTLTRITVEARP